MKEVLIYAGIWIAASIITMALWNAATNGNDEDNWPKP